jgi:hypothetical protein
MMRIGAVALGNAQFGVLYANFSTILRSTEIDVQIQNTHPRHRSECLVNGAVATLVYIVSRDEPIDLQVFKILAYA